MHTILYTELLASANLSVPGAEDAIGTFIRIYPALDRAFAYNEGAVPLPELLFNFIAGIEPEVKAGLEYSAIPGIEQAITEKDFLLAVNAAAPVRLQVIVGNRAGETIAASYLMTHASKPMSYFIYAYVEETCQGAGIGPEILEKTMEQHQKSWRYDADALMFVELMQGAGGVIKGLSVMETHGVKIADIPYCPPSGNSPGWVMAFRSRHGQVSRNEIMTALEMNRRYVQGAEAIRNPELLLREVGENMQLCMGDKMHAALVKGKTSGRVVAGVKEALPPAHAEGSFPA